jgi:hypothetical protein
MSKKRTTAEFIIEAKKVHGDKYDYSKTVYVGSQEKVCITCPKHGDYFIIAEGHLRGAGCPQCHNLSKRSNKESFIAKCREVYGDLYDYSKVEYIHSKEKVCVICPKHGEFWVTPNNHMRGSRCPACYGTPRKTTEQFIKEAKKIHGNKYDYSKVKYDGTDVKVCIVCSEHGEFWQTPYSHLKGCQCPVCSKVQRITQDIFIKRCTEIHHGRYDYSKVNFEHVKKKVCIICPEHGEFWQVPNNHLFGAGCPTCPESNMEGEIRQLLLNKGIIFEQEKGFDWLVYNRRMFLDFFLPEYGVAIECQGKQHFSPTEIFGGEEFYKMTVERDKVKKRLCEEHGIRVLYYSRSHIEYPYPVFESMRQLLKAIKDKGIVVDNQRWRNLQLELEFED